MAIKFALKNNDTKPVTADAGKAKANLPAAPVASSDIGAGHPDNDLFDAKPAGPKRKRKK